jgi:hypothetical protein
MGLMFLFLSADFFCYVGDSATKGTKEAIFKQKAIKILNFLA